VLSMNNNVDQSVDRRLVYRRSTVRNARMHSATSLFSCFPAHQIG